MSISYKLENFEGPLDLLLHLIEKNKMNIYDIPIVVITEQYLNYVSTMEMEDLNIVSEFLVMAATLIEIKSRMLLPKEVNEDGGEDDPRAELVARLLEYKYYKYMAFELKEKEVDADRLLFKEPTVPPQVARYVPPVDLDGLLNGLTLAALQKIFKSVIKKREDRIDPVRSQFGSITREPVSLEDKIDSILQYAKICPTFSFREMLEKQADKTEVVMTFLALLELMKIGRIHLSQEYLFADMLIVALESEEEEFIEG